MKSCFFYLLSQMGCPCGEPRNTFSLSKQAFNGIIKTLRVQAHLASDLLDECYQYVLPAKFQSDSVEKQFSQHRQMSIGNFLVSLREVINSKNTFLCRFLLKQNVCIWGNFLLGRQQVSKNKDFTQRFQEVFNQDKTENLYLCKKMKKLQSQ